jgi:glycosyltransferase involved in cell wall biosynthesis
VIVTARDEASGIVATIDALRHAMPGATILVADDGSRDGTAALAAGRGAEVIGDGRRRGKGEAATLAARTALERGGETATYLLCDGDLGASAAALVALRDAVGAGEADLVVAAFARRAGGGFGIAVGFARWMLRRRCGIEFSAPISGQRALRGDTLARLLPFAPRFGIEVAMTIDTVRGGGSVLEIPLELEHRATGRSLAGFAHRGRQLLDFAAVYARRR